jgi:hypothetical protein
MFARILSVILLIASLVVFTFGTYTSQRVARAEQKVAQAEGQAQGGRPVLGPVRRNVRDQASQNAQQKIGNQKQQIAVSAASVHWLHGIGIALFILGIVSLVFSFNRSQKNR